MFKPMPGIGVNEAIYVEGVVYHFKELKRMASYGVVERLGRWICESVAGAVSRSSHLLGHAFNCQLVCLLLVGNFKVDFHCSVMLRPLTGVNLRSTFSADVSCPCVFSIFLDINSRETLLDSRNPHLIMLRSICIIYL